MKATHFALAAALVATSGAAAAQSATDARCLILSNVFAQQTKDANAQKTAQTALYFYLGRVNQPASTLKATLEAQAKTITDANAGQFMNDCVKEMASKMQEMQSLSPAPPADKKATPQGR
jgi:hypothetical protein